MTETSCSQCGATLGPGDGQGYSHCNDHRHLTRVGITPEDREASRAARAEHIRAVEATLARSKA